ncbi:MAG: ABC transporter permease, partial [Rhodospirillaceae bacterium]
QVRDAVPAITVAAPLAQGSGTMVFRGRTYLSSVTGATPHLAAIGGLKMAEGRFLGAVDDGAAVAVLGFDAAAELGGEGRPPTVGDLVRIDDAVMEVIGLLEPTPRNTLLPTDFGRSVIVPLGSVGRIRAAPAIDAVLMKMAIGTDEHAAGRATEAYFATLGRGGEMRVESARQLIDSMRSQMKTVAGMIAALGGVALVVGGVGVMNVMLMSVLERRQEVGLRMAVGATRRDITLMFLAEAVVLSGLGAVCGLVLGLAACGLYALMGGIALAVSIAVLPLALGVALAVGVAAGLYPALAASRLDPVGALRAGG